MDPVKKFWNKIFISATIIPHHFGCLRELSVSCVLKFNDYFTFYWIKFLYEIWDYSQALYYVNISGLQPFIRLWIVFLDWITKSFHIKFLISKLTNIPYKDMHNLSSPSDCIQFSVSDNERMISSCIIHISDSRKSTINWSWGVETQTGFEYIRISKYIMIHYLSYKINDFFPPVI